MLLQRFMMYLETQDDAVFIESMIRCFAAPVARGVKCGSLLNLRRKGRDLRPAWARSRSALERALSLKFAELSPDGQSLLLLIYRDAPLLEAISSGGAGEMLLEYGYDCGFRSPAPYIREIARRFRTGAIPHEVGLFLGYPHVDVRGFIENRGRDSKFSGYWKVYGDVAGALKKFDEFKNAEAESLSDLLERAGRLNPAEAA
ncbi:MAG: DUF3793 family protein [Synergistaceae bacterium]|jgi:hypothetical protein|nr:DUF3793 family protein [Synergistaceae bacterium]